MQSDRCQYEEDAASTEMHRGSRKRKATYYARKDEKEHLEREEKELRSRLRRLKQYREKSQEDLAVAKLRATAQLNQLTFTGLESLVSTSLPAQSPISITLRLPRSIEARRCLLQNAKGRVTQDACAHMLARAAFVDLRKPLRDIRHRETAEGDLTTTHWIVKPLKEAESVATVFTELEYFQSTLEMSMAVKLDETSVREGDVGEDDASTGATQLRLLSTYPNCRVQVENNLAVFTTYADSSTILDRPHAVMVIHSVEDDALYPYQPLTRLRKDATSITMITTAPQDPSLVVFLKWGTTRVHNSTLVDQETLEDVAYNGATRWCDAMLRVIHEGITWRYHSTQVP